MKPFAVKPPQALGFYPDPATVVRFTKKIKTDKVTGCWEFTGYLTEDGYGTFSIRYKKYKAHRIAYEIFVGQLLDGEHVHHQCRNRKCCNPMHLEATSADSNLEDALLYRWHEFELCGGPYDGRIKHGNPKQPEAFIIIKDREGTHTYEYREGTYEYSGIQRTRSRAWIKTNRVRRKSSAWLRKKPVDSGPILIPDRASTKAA